MRRFSLWSWLVLINVILASLIALYAIPGSIIVDDAFITFRYALNLAEGNGLVYNLGEQYLGVTTPLYAMLLSLAYVVLPMPFEALAVLFHAGSAILSTLLVIRLLRRQPMPYLSLLFPVLFLPNYYVSVTVGMESVLFVAACLVAITLFRARSSILLGVVCSSLCLIRPDGALLVLLLFVFRWWEEKRFPLRLCMTGIVAAIPWLVFSMVYFGNPIPSSVGAKVDQANSFLWPTEHEYFPFLLSTVLLKHSMATTILGLLGIFMAFKRRSRLAILFSLWTLGHNGVYGISGVPGYPWYYVTYIFQMSFLSVYFLTSIRAASLRSLLQNKFKRRSFHRASAVGATLVGMTLLGSYVLSETALHKKLRNLDPTSNRYYHLGKWLKENTSLESTFAAAEIGILGFYSERKVIDLCGLVTPELSKLLRVGSQAVTAIETYSPDYILLHSPPISHEGGIEELLPGRYWQVHRLDDIVVYQRKEVTAADFVTSIKKRLTGKKPGTVFVDLGTEELNRSEVEPLFKAELVDFDLARSFSPETNYVIDFERSGEPRVRSFIEDGTEEGAFESVLMGRSPGKVYVYGDLTGFDLDAMSKKLTRSGQGFPLVTKWEREVLYLARVASSRVLSLKRLAGHGAVRFGASELFGWQSFNCDEFALVDGGLLVKSTGVDPFFTGWKVNLEGPIHRFRMRFSLKETQNGIQSLGSVSWRASEDEPLGPKVKTFAVQVKEGVQEAVVLLPPEDGGFILDFRIDPLTTPGTVIIHEVIFERE